MHVLQSFAIALEMLRLHKLRAFLTMLGVIIGVMSVTIIVMVSNGFQFYIDSEFKKLGADTIILMFDPGRQERGRSFGAVDGLSMEDVKYLRERVSALDIVSAGMQVPGQTVKYGTQEMKNPDIMAADEGFSQLNRLGVTEGRHFNAGDINERANVCVIGEDIKQKLFPDGNAIGKLVMLPGITLEVIGVLEKMEMMGDNTGRYMMVPITTAQDKWMGGNNVSFISMRPKAGIKSDDAMESVWQAMMVRSGNRAVYRLDSREAILNVLGGIMGAAGVILAAIAALSLLVGGIGIMNIMLVSVTERTKEIGLRKAVGAPARSILTQFLVESATLSLVGGLIGMTIAWMMGNVVSLITTASKWPTESGLATPFPITAALLAAAFSAFIGMVFGLYPAVSAAKLDPIVALRRE